MYIYTLTYIRKNLVSGYILLGATKQQLPTPFHHFKPTQGWNPKQALQAQGTSEVTITQNTGIVVFPFSLCMQRL